VSRRKRNQRGAATVAALILLITGLFLIFRAWGAAQMVLSPERAKHAAPAKEEVPLVQSAEERDAAIAAEGSPGRDPMHWPPAPPRPPRHHKPAEPPPLVPPTVRMILFDQVRPTVRIEVEGQLSGDLHVGDSFKGWTVVSIKSGTVDVAKDGKTFTRSM
jgi:hypothetical protein